MTFRVYRCGYLTQKKERGQMDDLRRLLQKHFNRTAEDVRLVIDPRPDCQIDGLIFKDGKLVVVELKNVGGTIIADLDRSSKWKIIEENGHEVPLNQENPFNQTLRHRIRLAAFTWRRVLGQKGDPPIEFRNQFSAWVVIKPRTDIKRVNWRPGDSYWFEVLPLDLVPRALTSERGGRDSITVQQLESLLQLLGAEERAPDEWMRPGPLVLAQSGLSKGVPMVGFLMESPEPDRVLSGLTYVLELDLRDYEADLFRLLSHGDERVREHTARILMLWEPPALCEVFGHMLVDDSPKLQVLALRSLQEHACPALASILKGFLEARDGNVAGLAVEALAASGCEAAGDIILSYAKREPVARYVAGLRQKRASRNGKVPLESSIRALGRLRYREAVSWLLEILDAAEAAGPIGEHLNIASLWEETLLALGEIGNPTAFESLLNALRTCGPEWAKTPIKALGVLGDERAVESLLPFLGDDDQWTAQETVYALKAIGSEKAFNRLCEHFLQGTSDGPLAITYPIMQALVAISPKRTEEFVLSRLRDVELHQEVKWRLMDLLGPVATEISMETLFSLLPDGRYNEAASDILARKIATPAVFERAQALLATRNPDERAAALYIMCHRWGVTLLSELEKYERNDAPEVRRVAALEYQMMNNASGRHRLLAMSGDRDPLVRERVYHAFFDEPLAALQGGWLCLADTLYSIGPVLLGEEAIVAGTEDRDRETGSVQNHSRSEDPILFVMDVARCERAAVVRVVESAGLYLRANRGGTLEQWLLIPDLWLVPWLAERELNGFLLKILGVTNRTLGPPELSDAEKDFVRTAEELLGKLSGNGGRCA